MGAGARALRLSTARVVTTCAVASDLYGITDAARDEDYLVLGKAHCFRKDDSGKLRDVFVIEPIPAGALECMHNGGATSYEAVTGVKWATVKGKDVAQLPETFADAVFCDEFDYRATCTARTWRRPHAQEVLIDLVPVGAVRSDFNVKLEHKRVLNQENVVTDADNIKQDMSIDVYGREKEASSEDIAKLYDA